MSTFQELNTIIQVLGKHLIIHTETLILFASELYSNSFIDSLSCFTDCPVIEITSSRDVKGDDFYGYYTLVKGQQENGRVIYYRKNNGNEFVLFSMEVDYKDYEGEWVV